MTEALHRVLVIMAHPDDPDFFCGGTLARWADGGKEIHYLLATSGDKGSSDTTIEPEQLAGLRELEQRAAAEVLGVQELVFLHHRDGELVSDLLLRRQLVRYIRLYRPDILVTTDPLKYYVGDRRINHPDHRAIGDAVLGAVFPAAGNHLCCPELWQVEGLAPHTPHQIFIAAPDQPNHQVDITDFIEQKSAAIRQHKSQLADPEASLARVRQRSIQPDGRYVEHFRRITFR